LPSLDDLRTFAKYHLVRRVHDHPAPETSLGLAPLPYDSRAYAETIGAYASRGWDVTTLERLLYRGRRYPMLLVRRAHLAGRRRLLVLAGVHGNEHAGLLAVPPILDAVEAEALGVDLCVVTPVDPVGAAHLSRYNADGFDINRDFVRFETPEARAVRRVFEERRPDFVVSLHEGPQDGTFLFTNRRVPAELALRLVGAVGEAGVPLASHDYFGRTLDPPGLAPMSRSMWALSVLWAASLQMMATGMWADGQGVPEITFESSWTSADREARVGGHVALVVELARALSGDDQSGHDASEGAEQRR